MILDVKYESKAAFRTRMKFCRAIMNVNKEYYGCIKTCEIAKIIKMNPSTLYRFANGENISQSTLEKLMTFFKAYEPARVQIAKEQLGLEELNVLQKLKDVV